MLEEIFSRRTFDFSAQAGDGIFFVIVRYLDVLAYRSATLLVRTYTATVPTGATLQLAVFRSAPSIDDPATDFFQSSPMALLSIGTATNSLDRLQMTSLGSHFHVMLLIDPRTPPAPFSVTLSLAVVLLERA